ncbi:hypothetical protein D3C76_208740 [compost metagenome]
MPPGDDRVVDEQVTGLQLGVEGTQFHRGATGGECVRRLAAGVAGFFGLGNWQDAGAAGAATAIEFQPEHALQVKAKAQRPLGITGFKHAEKALAPLFAVVLAAAATVTIEVVVAAFQVQAGTFDKTFGVICLGSGRYRCSQCNE